MKKLSYLPLGSADHTESFYTEIIVKALEPIERVLFIYDHDRNGIKGYKIVEKYKAKQPKINAIYYQPDYSNGMADNDSFFVEDLFSPASYQNILDELKSISQYNAFKSRKQSTCDMIKAHVSAHYTDVAFKEYYKGFQPLLDYLVEYFFPQPTEANGIYSEEALFQGKSDDIIHIYKSLKAAITALDNSITVHPLKHYIVLKNKEAHNILSIEIQSKKVLLYINKKKGTLVDKDGLTFDISSKGHLGNGDYKIEIASIDRIKPVIDFLGTNVVNNG